jgi:hypothetical protein
MIALTNVRALRALNMRRHGSKLVEIAVELGVTKERARQMAVHGAEIERRMLSDNPWYELSTRIRNCLVGDGCEPTPDGVVEHFKVHDWTRVPYFGKVCFGQLNAWLVHHGKEPIP